MAQPQYAIMRFAKYKGPEIGNIEAHNERTKENYASNPDIDKERTKFNFHLVTPQGKYRREAESQIAVAGCRTRKDCVRVVEALITATPDFFKKKKRSEIREYFEHVLAFIEKEQSKDTILSAVVQLDEKTPHMHLAFVPLTEDGRLCAKEIVGNKKKLTWWQDEFWKHMVEQYPALERGESAMETERKHIPPRVFKQMISLNKKREKLDGLLAGVNMFNAKSKMAEINNLLDGYIPAVEKMQGQLNRYQSAFTDTIEENEKLTGEKAQLQEELKEAQHESTVKKMNDLKLKHDYELAVETLERIPKNVLQMYAHRGNDYRSPNRNQSNER